MADILAYVKSYTSLLPRFSFTNFLEVLIIAVIVYEILQWIMDSKAWTLLKGIGIYIPLKYHTMAAGERLDHGGHSAGSYIPAGVKARS